MWQVESTSQRARQLCGSVCVHSSCGKMIVKPTRTCVMNKSLLNTMATKLKCRSLGHHSSKLARCPHCIDVFFAGARNIKVQMLRFLLELGQSSN